MLDDYLLHIPLEADPGISGQTPCVLGGQGYSTCSASQYLPNAHSVNKASGTPVPWPTACRWSIWICGNRYGDPDGWADARGSKD